MGFWPFSKKRVSESIQPPTIAESQLPTQDVLLLAQGRVLAEEMKSRITMGGFEDYQIAAAYAQIYTRVTDDRKRTIREVERMRNFYLVDTIISMLVEDALAPEVGTGEILNVTSKRAELQKEIEKLEEKFDFDQLALTLAPDIICYGDYILATDVKKSPEAERRRKQGEALNASVGDDSAPEKDSDEFGLIDLLDNVDQGSVVALTKYANIEGYLVNNEGGMPERRDPADFVKFSLNSARIRIDLHKEFSLEKKRKNGEKSAFDDIPRYVRCGKSVIFPILSKLKELELLEAMVPATKLSKLSNGTVLGVQVPPGFDIEKGMEAAKKVEQLINKKVGVDSKLGELTLENIIAAAGKHKVIPMFGDKGSISKIDYKSDEPDEMLNSIADLRKAILTSAGIPYELLFNNENGDSAGSILKKYARYLRKLKAIQKALEEGFRQIVYIHLANKGFSFKAEDIKVEFYNKLIEVDHLDHLEFADTTIGMMTNVQNFILSLASKEQNPAYAHAVDISSCLEFMNNHLNMIGFKDVINVEKYKGGTGNGARPNPFQPVNLRRPSEPEPTQTQPEEPQTDDIETTEQPEQKLDPAPYLKP